MKAIIQIVHVVVVAGRSKKTGNDYDMRMAQCVVQKVDRVTGVVTPMIGVLNLPERYKEIPKGNYVVEFEVAIAQNSRVGSDVCDIAPFDPASSAAPGVKSIVDVLAVAPMAGRSKKTGNDYDMRFAQCIVHKVDRATGLTVEMVGELLLPDRYKAIQPGRYEVEFEVAITREKRVDSQVFEMVLVPVVDVRAPSKPVESLPPKSVSVPSKHQSKPGADDGVAGSF